MIERKTAEVCEQRLGAGLRALILTGSVARNEATIDSFSSPVRLHSDAEFICVLQNSVVLPGEAEAAKLADEIVANISSGGVSCHISLAFVHEGFLRKMRPHIFAYELRNCGHVVAGDERILSLMPEFTPHQIPLEDAWYLLCNRTVELLEHSTRIGDQSVSEVPKQVFYSTVKMYIDMATSFLVFQGRYAPTYSARAQQLRIIAAEMPSAPSCSLDLGNFSKIVSACTSWKLGDKQENAVLDLFSDGFSFWRTAIRDAQSLWRWELEQMTATTNLPDRQLMQSWMRRQSKTKCLRGWMLVLRQQGWARSWQMWPRWFRLGLRASPRYWIYAAASELLFRLPVLMRGTAGTISPLLDFLPVVRRGGDGALGPDIPWRRLASEIEWNYDQFVVNTRS